MVIPKETEGRGWDVEMGDVNGDGALDVFIGGWGTQVRLLLGKIHSANQRTELPALRIVDDGAVYRLGSGRYRLVIDEFVRSAPYGRADASNSSMAARSCATNSGWASARL
jgi:hypothetical protein